MSAATAPAISSDRAVSGVYKPRNPAASHYCQCVSAHWEELEPAWNDLYQRRYGFFRSYVKEVMPRFLDCGDLQKGFARVRCHDCGYEYPLAFSCKRRHFCPSCYQKRVAEFGEWLCAEVLKCVPHGQWVFSVPKRLRPWFSHNRRLLAGLSKFAWKILSRYIIRAAFSQERMQYIPDPAASDGRAKVIYQSKGGRDRKVFSALDWLAQLTTHIPNRREHMVRYGACPALDAGATTATRAGDNGKRRIRMTTLFISSRPACRTKMRFLALIFSDVFIGYLTKRFRRLLFLKRRLRLSGKSRLKSAALRISRCLRAKARVREIQPPVAKGPGRIRARRKMAIGETIEWFFLQ